jgi:hypothetical protein
MQNILDIQNDLKNTSDEHLVNLMQMPEPNFPQYLVLSEMDRRKEMRESYDAAQASQPTVAQQLTEETANSGVTQGLGSLDAGSVRGAEMISNATDMPVIYGNTPVRSMANGGGRMGYQNTGQVNIFPDLPTMMQNLTFEQLNEIENNPEGPLAQEFNRHKARLEGIVSGREGLSKSDKWKLAGVGAALTPWGKVKGLGQTIGPYAKTAGTWLGKQPGIRQGLEHIGSIGSKAKIPFDYGLKNISATAFGPSRTVAGTSIPLAEAGKQYAGTYFNPLTAAGGIRALRGLGTVGGLGVAGKMAWDRFFPEEDTLVEDTTTESLNKRREELINENLVDEGGIEDITEVKETIDERGRKEDINTALVSLARIASAKPNELGNILASAGKDVATAKRERRRDDLSEKLMESQAEYYKARAGSAEGDKYQKAQAAFISAHKAFDSLAYDEKISYSPTGRLATDDEKAAARESFILRNLAGLGLLEAYQEFQAIVGGSFGGPSKVIQAETYTS